MRRKRRYLAVAAIALAKPFLAGVAGVAFGLSDSGPGGAELFTYLLFPQIVPVLCLFFLYYDEHKYAAFRPLAMLLGAGSLLLFLVSGIRIALDASRFVTSSSDAATLIRGSLACILCALADLAILLVLSIGGPHRAEEDEPAPQTPSDKDIQ